VNRYTLPWLVGVVVSLAVPTLPRRFHVVDPFLSSPLCVESFVAVAGEVPSPA
jgi:hypothetical protein